MSRAISFLRDMLVCARSRSTRGFGRRALVVALAATLGVAAAATPGANAQQRFPLGNRFPARIRFPVQNRFESRSVSDWRTRIPDELDWPRTRERVTHKGWEVRTKNVVVISNGARRDSELAAQAFQESWNDVSGLADTFATEHRRGNFGVNSTLVFIDRYSRETKPQPRIDAVRDQAAVYLPIPVDGGVPADWTPIVKEAAVHALFHAANWDQKAPAWLRVGLARNLSHGASDADSPWLYPDHMTLNRETPDRLQSAPDLRREAAWVDFLLDADNGRFAWRMLDVLASAPSPSNGLDELRDELRLPFTDWSQGQRVARPKLVSAPYEDEELHRLQNDLFVLLEIARRWNAPRIAAPTRPTVSEFGRDQDKADKAKNESPPVSLINSREFQRRLTNHRWSIRDAQGRLVLASQGAALAGRVELLQGRARIERRGDQWSIDYQWSGGYVLRGRHEVNEEDGTSAIRFSLVSQEDPVERRVEKAVEPTKKKKTVPVSPSDQRTR